MKRILACSLTALFLCLTIFSTPPSKAPTSTNWAQWRGPDSQGVSTEKNLPTEWSESKHVLWKAALPGTGFSQPIIWGKKVFVTTGIEGDKAPAEHKPPKHMLDEKQEFKHPDWTGVDKLHTFKVLCLDRDSGKVLWEKTAYQGTVVDYRHKKGNYSAPTPVTDGKYVFAYFGSEGLYCYDLNGKEVWKKSLGQIFTLGMGVGTSPILHENLVIIQADQNTGQSSFIAAFDKKTGKEIWRTPRKVQVSWATPVLVKADNRTELITSGNEAIIAYDPKTGKEYWHCKGIAANAVPTPVAGNGLVIVSAGFPAKNIIAIRPGGTGDIEGTDRIVWRYNKGTAYVPSPILYDGYLYLMNDAGVLTCLEPATGKVVYEGGRVPTPTKFTGASPVAFDGKILLTSDDGDTFVIKAGPRHEVLATNSLGEPCRTSIAIADGRLFIRGEKHLYCIGNSTKLAKN